MTRGPRRSSSAAARDGGFTVIEVMIALTILLIGLAGLLGMQLSGMRATAFSRHATEASMLAEDKMEALRTEPTATLASNTDQVDARGVLDANGLYTRTWTVSSNGTETIVVVEVAWAEQGAEPHSVTMTTMRSL